MQVPALMQRAQDRAQEPKGGGEFKRPDAAQFTPPDQKDAVERVVAAGMKLMYSPAMREELKAEIARDVPVPQKLAEAVTGLLLTLDKQSQGGIPVGALFPAGLELLSESAQVLTAAGQPVGQADYNTAAQMMFVQMGRKMGASDEQMMGTLEQQVGGGYRRIGGYERFDGLPRPHEAPQMEQQETQAEAQGLPEPDEQMRRA